MNDRFLSRRTLLRGAVGIGAAGVVTTLAACTSGGSVNDTPSAAPEAPTDSTPSATASGRATGSRTLLAYFSRAGEQYWDGGRRTVDVGNTAVIAGFISDLIDVDVYRIQPSDPYPQAYEPTVQRNVQELRSEARPAIADPLPSFGDYDTILLGNPVWASQEPMIMRSFLDNVGGLAGATVHPFVTYAVSELGSVVTDYTERYADASFTQPLAIRGEEARSSEDDVRSWLTKLGLL